MKRLTLNMKFQFAILLTLLFAPIAEASTTTWDGKHSTENIDVTVVYFVPKDRVPLPDWQDRVDYFCKRIEQFHKREFGTQSIMKTHVHPEPFVSAAQTATLRQGDGNAVFFRTLREVDAGLKFAKDESGHFPILLVLSDINWQPLDDFYRLKPDGEKGFVMDGNLNQGQHFPGAAAGGSRATYLAAKGVGWGLVSGDGWRVPCRGSDCVVYHEGCGHTVGLPHPEPGNGSVMSQGQYRGWINESSLDKEQKSRMGWHPEETEPDLQEVLFSSFTALPNPMVPKPGQEVQLDLNWPADVDVKSVRVRLQTAIDGAWVECQQANSEGGPAKMRLGSFDRPTPVSYRIDAALETGETAELWGYFQVRSDPEQAPLPVDLSIDLRPESTDAAPHAVVASTKRLEEIDLLKQVQPKKDWKVGEWTLADGHLQSPKAYGARIELPYQPQGDYRLCLIVEPIDPPQGLLLGQNVEGNRVAALLQYVTGDQVRSALENVDGQNVGNPTTVSGSVFQQGRLSQVIVTVRKDGLHVDVDGQRILTWEGAADRLSLSDYWNTPDKRKLFVGAYDCRYRFHRISVAPLD